MSTSDLLRFDGQVVIITGAGRGLGKEYALLLGARGARVVVNDLGGAYDGLGPGSSSSSSSSSSSTTTTSSTSSSPRVADVVVAEIVAAGGEAVANYDSVTDGAAIVQTALDAFGRLDIVINNAGILTPETWETLELAAWRRTLDVNLTGVFQVLKAAWPVLKKQGYGRIINVASPAIYGAGVAAYSASKAALIGLSASLQFEARKLQSKGCDIVVNTVIPQADTRMTQDFAKDVAVTRAAQVGNGLGLPW